MFSKRTEWRLSPNDLSEILDKLKGENTPYIDLTLSNPTRCEFCYPAEILNALHNLENVNYNPAAKGLPGAREAVARSYQRKGFLVSPEDIVLTSSTSEAYSYLFRLLIDPGEAALFPKPSYPLFEFLTNLNDVNIDYYPLVYNQGWGIDLESFEHSVCADTQAAVFVNPNNPTGSYIQKKERDRINHICRNRKLPIISDEVFFDYSFGDSGEGISFCGNPDVLTFTLGGLSKSMGLPQMKLSWIVVSGPEKLKKEALQRLDVIADTFLSVNTPVQNALGEWLRFEPDIQQIIGTRVKQNFAELTRQVEGKTFVELLHAAGGWYVVLKFRKDVDEEQFAQDLLREDHVLVHPGYFYDFENGDYVILSLLPPEKDFQEGVMKLLKKIHAI